LSARVKDTGLKKKKKQQEKYLTFLPDVDPESIFDRMFLINS